MISGKSNVCGIIANPVEHSLSPFMHNFFAEKTGVDMVYVPLKVEKNQVKEAVEGAYALNIKGMNVTVPYKQMVMEHLEEIHEDARIIGAVNTLVRHNQGYKGYNTDAAGLLRSMQEKNIIIKESPCILIGAGGAAKAAAYILAKEGAEVIYILNRSMEKAQKLADSINQQAGRTIMIPQELERYQELPKASYIVIQSTSVGMEPLVHCAPVEDPDFYKNVKVGIDLIYTPFKTKFMEYVEAAGSPAYNGLDMLIYQGIIAYELWNPHVVINPEVIDEIRAALIQRLEGKQ